MLKKLLIPLVMAFAVPGVATVTNVAFVPEAQAWSLKNAVKKVGRGIKKGAKAVGRGTKRGAKAVGRGTKRGAKAVGRGTKRGAKAAWRGTKRGAKAVGRGTKRGAKAVGRGTKRGAKAVWRGAKCIAKGGCATIGRHAGALHQGFVGDREQIVGTDGGERAAMPADRRAHPVDDDDFPHGRSLPLCLRDRTGAAPT